MQALYRRVEVAAEGACRGSRPSREGHDCGAGDGEAGEDGGVRRPSHDAGPLAGSIGRGSRCSASVVCLPSRPPLGAAMSGPRSPGAPPTRRRSNGRRCRCRCARCRTADLHGGSGVAPGSRRARHGWREVDTGAHPRAVTSPPGGRVARWKPAAPVHHAGRMRRSSAPGVEEVGGPPAPAAGRAAAAGPRRWEPSGREDLGALGSALGGELGRRHAGQPTSWWFIWRTRAILDIGEALAVAGRPLPRAPRCSATRALPGCDGGRAGAGEMVERDARQGPRGRGSTWTHGSSAVACLAPQRGGGEVFDDERSIRRWRAKIRRRGAIRARGWMAASAPGCGRAGEGGGVGRRAQRVGRVQMGEISGSGGRGSPVVESLVGRRARSGVGVRCSCTVGGATGAPALGDRGQGPRTGRGGWSTTSSR